MSAFLPIAITATIIFLVSLPFSIPFLWKRISSKFGRSPQDTLVNVIVDVIGKDFHAWDKDSFRLTHEGLGFSIWIGNEEYGIGLSTNGELAFPINDRRNNMSLTSGQRYKIWKAIQNPMQQQSKDEQRKTAEEIIERVIKHYEAVQQPKTTYFPAATTYSWSPVVHIGGAA